MARPPIRTGELDGAAVELLRELEQDRITGVLRFDWEGGSGEIALFGGEIAEEQAARGDGQDPLDVFLATSRARYEVHQRLPPLAVAKGDDYSKHGSLAVHVPADLMNYCERAGLTGVLELTRNERRARAVYRAGELFAIELDGRDDADLSDVFAWEEGRFRIEIDHEAPARVESAPAWSEAPPKKREDTRQFLRVVEMALVDVVARSEKARSPTRTSPPMPPPPKSRPPVAPRAMRRTDEHTVKLIYLSGEAPSDLRESSTRHLAVGGSERDLTPESEEMAKKRKEAPVGGGGGGEGESERRSAREADGAAAASGAPAAGAGPAEAEAAPRGNPLHAAGWAAVVMILGLVILAGLSGVDAVISRMTCEAAAGPCRGASDCCAGLSCQSGRCARE